ncbi:hypothetical protein ACTXT7_001377 [Hymenolepis weldensis]
MPKREDVSKAGHDHLDVHVVFKNTNHKSSNLSKGMKTPQIPISAILLLPVVMGLQRAAQTTEMSDLFLCSKMVPDLKMFKSADLK